MYQFPPGQGGQGQQVLQTEVQGQAQGPDKDKDKDKEKPPTTSPDSPEATVNDIPCDQCAHPKSMHRQKKYYCMADVIYNDPVNNNEPIKAPCSCTLFANAEDEGKKKKDKEQKEKDKEKPPKKDVDSPDGKHKDKKPDTTTAPSEIGPTNTGQGGVVTS